MVDLMLSVVVVVVLEVLDIFVRLFIDVVPIDMEDVVRIEDAVEVWGFNVVLFV